MASAGISSRTSAPHCLIYRLIYTITEAAAPQVKVSFKARLQPQVHAAASVMVPVFPGCHQLRPGAVWMLTCHTTPGGFAFSGADPSRNCSPVLVDGASRTAWPTYVRRRPTASVRGARPPLGLDLRQACAFTITAKLYK